MGEKLVALSLVAVLIVAGAIVFIPVDDKEDTFTVTLDLMDGRDDVVLTAYDGRVKLMDYEADGDVAKYLSGWVSELKLDSNDELLFYEPGDTITVKSDMKLYAVWMEMSVTAPNTASGIIDEFIKLMTDDGATLTPDSGLYGMKSAAALYNNGNCQIRITVFTFSNVMSAMQFYVATALSKDNVYNDIENHLQKECCRLTASTSPSLMYEGINSAVVVRAETLTLYDALVDLPAFNNLVDRINALVLS